MRVIDVLGGVIGAAFVGISMLSMVSRDYVSSAATLLGGTYLMADSRRNRREMHSAVWAAAASDDDPVGVLALCEYLYRLPLADLQALADWVPGDPVPPVMLDALRVQQGAA